MREWIRILDACARLYCYDRMAWAERKSALQSSGLVRTVGPCTQSRVPRAIATARDGLYSRLTTLSHDCDIKHTCVHSFVSNKIWL